jgi:hypothetical protein
MKAARYETVNAISAGCGQKDGNSANAIGFNGLAAGDRATVYPNEPDEGRNQKDSSEGNFISGGHGQTYDK